jgi:hypothetical protein
MVLSAPLVGKTTKAVSLARHWRYTPAMNTFWAKPISARDNK